FSFTLPISGQKLPSLRLRYQQMTDYHRDQRHKLSLQGSTLEDFNLGYGLTVSQSKRYGTSLDMDIDYSYSAGQSYVAYSKGKHYRELQAQVSGSMLLHRDG